MDDPLTEKLMKDGKEVKMKDSSSGHSIHFWHKQKLKSELSAQNVTLVDPKMTSPRFGNFKNNLRRMEKV